MIVLNILLAFVCLSVMVVIHEGGHFIAGRKLGFKINEFAIGMGPKIISKKLKSGLVVSWRLIPIGGFCAFDGEDMEKDSPDSFNSQKPWKRLIVLFAGVFTNFISALIILSAFFMISGQTLPCVAPLDEYAKDKGIIYEVIGTGDDAVLKTVTVVDKVNGKSVQILEGTDFTKMLENEEKVTLSVLIVDYESGKVLEKKSIELERHTFYEVDENGNYVYDEEGIIKSSQKLGLAIGYKRQTFGFFDSIWRASKFSLFTAGKILGGLGGLISGALKPAEAAGGPITMITGLANMVQTGLANTIYIVCIFSVNLAIFNLLPIPALDGGRMVFTIIEWIRKKPIKREIEAKINLIGLLLLFGIAIAFDLIQLFTWLAGR